MRCRAWNAGGPERLCSLAPPPVRTMIDSLSGIEAADIAVAEATAPVGDTALGRTIGELGKLGDQPPMIAFALLTAATGALRDDRRLARAGVRMLAAHALATGMKVLVKRGVDRSRPSLLLERGHYEAHPGHNDDHDLTSFPSGHTAGVTAVARAFSRHYPEYAGVSAAAALGLSLIQIPRRAHFVSDIVAGAALGLLGEAIVATAWPNADLREPTDAAPGDD